MAPSIVGLPVPHRTATDSWINPDCVPECSCFNINVRMIFNPVKPLYSYEEEWGFFVPFLHPLFAGCILKRNLKNIKKMFRKKLWDRCICRPLIFENIPRQG